MFTGVKQSAVEHVRPMIGVKSRNGMNAEVVTYGGNPEIFISVYGEGDPYVTTSIQDILLWVKKNRPDLLKVEE